MSFLRRPQTNLLRRVLFQIHLWTGIGVALYVIVIGLSGAALVFRPELQAMTFPQVFASTGSSIAEPETVVRELEAAYPGAQLAGIDFPTHRRGTFLSYLVRDKELLPVYSDPVTGRVLGEMPKRSWINTLQEIHFDLFAGPTGRTVNGIAAFLLIAMFGTGLVVWWPGIDRWRKRLTIDFRSGWKRTNWDLHSALGFWLFAILMIWAVTGVQFAFPRQFRSVVNSISPLTVRRTPESSASSGPRLPEAETLAVTAKARTLVPGAKLGRIVPPSNARAATLILLAYNTHGDFDTSDEVLLYFDQYTGELLERRDTGALKLSAGDQFMKWIGPIHLGSFAGPGVAGIGVKTLWAMMAVSFPALAVTGVLMWWNRALASRLKKQARSTAVT